MIKMRQHVSDRRSSNCSIGDNTLNLLSPVQGSEMDELGRWMSAHSSIFIHLLSEICSCSLIHLKMDSTLVEGSLIHLKMDLSRRRCSLIHLRCAAVQWQILIFSPSGCPEPASFCKARGQVADSLAASSCRTCLYAGSGLSSPSSSPGPSPLGPRPGNACCRICQVGGPEILGNRIRCDLRIWQRHTRFLAHA